MKGAKERAKGRFCIVCGKRFVNNSVQVALFCPDSCAKIYKGNRKGLLEKSIQTGRLSKDSIIAWLLAGNPEEDWNPPKRCTPTNAHPGTWEKVEVLAQRFLAGEDLWHEHDAGRWDDEAKEAAMG